MPPSPSHWVPPVCAPSAQDLCDSSGTRLPTLVPRLAGALAIKPPCFDEDSAIFAPRLDGTLDLHEKTRDGIDQVLWLLRRHLAASRHCEHGLQVLQGAIIRVSWRHLSFTHQLISSSTKPMAPQGEVRPRVLLPLRHWIQTEAFHHGRCGRRGSECIRGAWHEGHQAKLRRSRHHKNKRRGTDQRMPTMLWGCTCYSRDMRHEIVTHASSKRTKPRKSSLA